MVIDFQSTNFKADQKLLNFIQEKLSKLEKLHNKIVNATVYMKVDNTSEKSNKTLEVKVNIADTQLFVTETDKTFEIATDKAMEALRHQLEKHKTRTGTN